MQLGYQGALSRINYCGRNHELVQLRERFIGPPRNDCLASSLLGSDLHVERDDGLLLDDEYDMSGEINAPIGHTITHRLHLSNHAGRPIRSSCDAIKDRDYRRMTLIIPAAGPTAGRRHRAQLRAAELAGSRRVSPRGRPGPKLSVTPCDRLGEGARLGPSCHWP